MKTKDLRQPERLRQRVLPAGIPTPGLQWRAQQKAKRIRSLRGVGVEGRPQYTEITAAACDLARGRREAQQAQSKEQAAYPKRKHAFI